MAYSSLVFNWEIPGENEINTFDELRFPIKFYQTPDKSALYFAFQYILERSKESAYGGFQPTEPEGSEPHYFQYIFSSFMSDIRDYDKNSCHLGADGGDGCTCRIVKPADIRTWYSLRVRAETKYNQNYDYYIGSIINDDTGVTLIRIGMWAVDKDKGGLFKNSYTGFIEPYLDNPINDRHVSDVLYGIPKGYRDGKEYIGKPISNCVVRDESELSYDITYNDNGTVRIKSYPKVK